MLITMQAEAFGISVVYRREDGYVVKRNARLLIEKLERAGESAAALAGYTVRFEYEGKPRDDFEIEVGDRLITVHACGILSYQLVQDYFDRLLESGEAPRSYVGSVGASFTDSNRHAFDRKGTYRVMFYNVLWDNDFLRMAWERNIMTAHIVREFSPAVVGFQECGTRKRAECCMYDFAKMMNGVAYVETPVEVKNEYRNDNCTPLFYDPEQVEYLDGAYVWYSRQAPAEEIGRMDRSSKSMTWGLFEDKKTKERYIVATTHMCTQKDEIRELQAKEACELYDQLKEKYNVPIIMGGDFNSVVNSKGYGYYRAQGYPNAMEIATLDTCDIMTYHPYPAYDASYEMVMKTANAEHTPARSVDHILFPHKPESLEAKVYGVLVNDFTLAASDHFPLFVDFSF